MSIKVKKLHPDAILPTRAKDGDAGLDLTAISAEFDGSNYVYRTGIAIEIPRGQVGLIFPRSSIANTYLQLSNSVGVIDSGFRGEIVFKFNQVEGKRGRKYEVGERVGQLVIVSYNSNDVTEVDELSSTDRGENGFGSSGK